MLTTIGTRANRPTDASVESGLRVVGVEHVDVLAPEDPPELARGAQVGAGDPSRGSTTTSARCSMPSASSSSTHGPGALMPIGAATEIAYGAELREHEEAQAHVDRGEVRDRQPAW